MRTKVKMTSAACVLALTAACGGLPEQVETLDQARSAVNELQQDPLAQDVAPDRLQSAEAALARAEEGYEASEDLELIEHDAYVALRNAQIAEQQIAERRAREQLEQGEAQRNEVLLQAREREAEQAQELAAQRGAELEQQTQQTRQAQQRAAALEQQTQELQQQTRQLEEQLAELEAQETDRGWVLTLEDVLFNFGEAQLNPGAASTIDRIAEFLSAHPERNIVVEGHTDAVGPAPYNQELSRERALAVRQALTDRGIEASRVEIVGLGEEYPVATNETTAGRQLNRRVEVVLSGDDGEFAGEQRTASADPVETQG